MTFFLRDKNNTTYVDIDCWVKDGIVEISAFIPVKAYSSLLLRTPEVEQAGLIKVFAMLSEIRGWLWERYFMGRQNTAKEYDNVVKALREILDTIGGHHGLHRIED